MTAMTDRYSLGRTPEEYERLRAQARMWEAPTGRLLDQVGLAPGARCLDAGCGPGETMRLMAHRVGPAGTVTGIDIDAGLGPLAQAMLHEAGHRQCRVLTHDLTADEPVPGGTYDLVYTRLLLFHLPQRVPVLARLWSAVAPGGHLVVQDYDMSTAGSMAAPGLASVDEAMRVINAAFLAAGCDTRTGTRLGELFVQAGVGAPDGTDVAGQVGPMPVAQAMMDAVFRSLLPVALARGITTADQAEQTLGLLARESTEHAHRFGLFPLLVAAWKRKPA